jgi:hypothetical protein
VPLWTLLPQFSRRHFGGASERSREAGLISFLIER